MDGGGRRTRAERRSGRSLEGGEHCRESRAVAHAELDIDVIQVALDRAPREVHPLSDLPARATVRRESRDLTFTLAQSDWSRYCVYGADAAFAVSGVLL